MAKRRQLQAPTREELRAIEEGFARETLREPLSMSMPIASVAAEAAALMPVASVEERSEAARNRRDAETLRDADARGLLAHEVALSAIGSEEMVRDRMALDPEEMSELRTSIQTHGLRLPIEVFELAVPRAGVIYGLISGYRRLAAFRALLAETGSELYARIPAIVRKPDGAANAFVAMVEENEIRSGLSQYERGRVAVVATENGAFTSVDAAIDALFASGSKAKRSKLRSFAWVHEELGDLLNYPQALSERQGLRLAGALRAGDADQLRQALASGVAGDADEEWRRLEAVILQAEDAPRDTSRGGRPRRTTAPMRVIELRNGLTIRHETGSKGHTIHIDGAIDPQLIEQAIRSLENILDR
ncbi:ParB N-terminal domain-containing protein [Paracoccus sp. (in: a-proteobacteria)]|uniref:ParB/RepB/Spo0J family partition protein n=1 Tax=Paracoccus sp. TaxID=267 RepID=UPI002898FE6A|nr:ParB N-terminal domain-containing protein [Paracoccus sp. (in: a-proteobacteria)]